LIIITFVFVKKRLGRKIVKCLLKYLCYWIHSYNMIVLDNTD